MNATRNAYDNNNIVVEIADTCEYEEWLPLWQQYIIFYEANIPEHITKKTWQRFSDLNEPVFCAVAKLDGSIVGLVHFLFHRSTWSESYYCYLEDLFVSPDMRGQQVGKRLIEFVQQQASEYPASGLYWHTHQMNFRGQRLYDWVAKKSGMIEYRMSIK